MSILYLVHYGNGYVSGLLSYEEASTYFPTPLYVLRYYFRIFVSVRTYDISTPLQSSTVWIDWYRMYCRENSIVLFVHDYIINFN